MGAAQKPRPSDARADHAPFVCAAAPPPGKQELLSRELRPPARARERRPQPPPMATRWCAFQQMPSSPAIVGHGRCAPAQPGQRRCDGGRAGPWTGHREGLHKEKPRERTIAWFHARALVSASVEQLFYMNRQQARPLEFCCEQEYKFETPPAAAFMRGRV